MITRSLGTVLLGWLGACSVEPVPGVIHLDPRLEDGRSPARVLAAGQRRMETLPTDWTASPGATFALITPADTLWSLSAPDTGSTATLTFGAALRTQRWDALEVVARFGANTDARLSWSSAGRTYELRARAPLTLEPELLRFELSGHPNWTGDVADVALELALGDKRAELSALTFVAGGFRAGDEPLAEGRGDDASGDGGLLTLGQDARRVWPTDVDMPLFARARAPAGGVLALSVAPGTGLTGTPTKVTFRIEARSDGREWQPLDELRVPTPTGREAEAWTPWYVPLEPFDGGDVELRFSGWLEDAPTSSDRPPSARLLFATPELLGTLPDQRRPNIVLVTLDTLRADALGQGWTPVLDELAQRGLTFTNAWSAAESTTPSHASILTGKMVQEHGAVGNRFVLPPQNQTLAELLRAAGYHTAAAVSAFHLQSGNGFGQGFDQFYRPRRQALTNGSFTVAGLAAMIDEWSAGPPRPLFLWLHLFDPHTPYGAPGDFRRSFLKEHGHAQPPALVDPPTTPYFDEYPGGFSWLEGTTSVERVRFNYHLGVAHADHLVGQLCAALERADALAETALVITSDHGEGFGERDIWFSHVGLFREILHVPLIVALPADSPFAQGPTGSFDTAVSAIDIAPTILQLARAEGADALSGRSLFASIVRPDDDRRIWFQHSGLYQAGFRDGDVHFVDTLDDGIYYLRGAVVDEAGRRTPDWGTFDAGARFLFDLNADPSELENLAARAPTEDFAESVSTWIDVLGRTDAQRAELSAEDERLLKSLGYAGD